MTAQLTNRDILGAAASLASIPGSTVRRVHSNRDAALLQFADFVRAGYTESLNIGGGKSYE